MEQSNLDVQEALRKSEARYHRLITRMSAIIFELDDGGSLLTVNDAVVWVTGYAKEELLGTNWIDLLFRADLRPQVDQLLERLHVGDVSNYEILMAKKDGSLITLEMNSANEYNESGEIEKIIGFCLDVTERKRSEERLRRNERALAEAQKIAHLGSWIWDIPSDTVSWSDELYRIYGLTPEEGGQSYEEYLERVHPDDREMVNETVMKAYQDGLPFSFLEHIVRPDGEIRILSSKGEVICGKDGRPVRMMGICHDITEQKIVEQSLRESDERYRLIIENAREYAIFTLDPDGYVTSWNAGAEHIKGYTADEIIGQHFSVFYPEAALADRVPAAVLEKARSLGKFEDEGWRVCKDGSRFWANVVITALYDENGNLRGYSKVTRDMSERKKTEERLRASEARFRSIFDGAGFGIELLDLEGHLIAVNPAVGAMFGYSPEEIRQIPPNQMSHPVNFVAGLPVFGDLRNGERDIYHTERLFVHKDGNFKWGHLAVSLVRDAEGVPQFIVGMIEDVTERKQMEAELAELSRRLMEGRESERLHLAQELHDGPVQDLYGLSYNISALKESLTENANLETIRKMDDLVQKVVTTLKAISGELRPPALTPFGLEKAIRSYVEGFMEGNSELSVSMDLVPDGKRLPEQVRLALFRIFQSSFTNVIRHAEAKNVYIRLGLDEEKAILEIQDDGKGFVVPNRWITLARKGHLGLVGAQERASAIGGQFEVKSAPGEGTKITVLMPLNDLNAASPENAAFAEKIG